ALPLGRLHITVNKPGFGQTRIGDIDLNSGVTRTINAQLQVASASQTVNIEADRGAEQLDKNDATFGGTIESVQVAKLPLNRRNTATLDLLAPGAIGAGSGQQLTIRSAGQGVDDSNYRFDGVAASGGIRK